MLILPGSPASRIGHVMSFWPRRYDRKLQGGVFRNTFETGQLQWTHCFGFVSFLFFPPIFSCLGSRLECQRDFWLCSHENGSSVEWRVSGRLEGDRGPRICSLSEPSACGPSTYPHMENTSFNLFKTVSFPVCENYKYIPDIRSNSKGCGCYFHTYSSILWFTAVSGQVRFFSVFALYRGKKPHMREIFLSSIFLISNLIWNIYPDNFLDTSLD